MDDTMVSPNQGDLDNTDKFPVLDEAVFDERQRASQRRLVLAGDAATRLSAIGTSAQRPPSARVRELERALDERAQTIRTLGEKLERSEARWIEVKEALAANAASIGALGKQLTAAQTAVTQSHESRLELDEARAQRDELRQTLDAETASRQALESKLAVAEPRDRTIARLRDRVDALEARSAGADALIEMQADRIAALDVELGQRLRKLQQSEADARAASERVDELRQRLAVEVLDHAAARAGWLVQWMAGQDPAPGEDGDDGRAKLAGPDADASAVTIRTLRLELAELERTLTRERDERSRVEARLRTAHEERRALDRALAETRDERRRVERRLADADETCTRLVLELRAAGQQCESLDDALAGACAEPDVGRADAAPAGARRASVSQRR